MIRELAIKNFAIIEDLRIQFNEGMTVLSGETGAGKSIIINSINLLLGKRASADMIRTGSDTAELEAEFLVPEKSTAAKKMKASGFDPSDGLVVRRIIFLSNRHKIYINGRLATVQQLTTITENLTSISGQHAHQGLLDEDRHLFLLDQFADLLPLRKKIFDTYHKLLPLIKKVAELSDAKNRQDDQSALLEFQKKEIEDANLSLSEEKDLEREKTRLKNSEDIFRSITLCINLLYDGSGAVSEQLSEVRKSIEKTSRMDPELSRLCEDVGDVSVKIDDITQGLRSYIRSVQMDEARLDAVEERIDEIQKLKRKYGGPMGKPGGGSVGRALDGSVESIFNYLEHIRSRLDGLMSLDHEIEETTARLQSVYDTMVRLAGDLSKKRRKAALTFSKKVESELADLKMAGTAFDITIQPIPAGRQASPYLSIDGMGLDETGVDRAVFKIAPNIGEDMKPLSSIASGGELSRVVLALKAIIAKTGSLETVVFDEVDAGIGGGTAEVVGKKLLALSKYHQIICITHLAQIAKFAHHHFNISKSTVKDRTRTDIKPLNQKERVNELARMLGGEKITPATMDHARELINS